MDTPNLDDLTTNATSGVGIITKFTWFCHEALGMMDCHESGSISEARSGLTSIVFGTLHRTFPVFSIFSF
jgi:hypothetical protein